MTTLQHSFSLALEQLRRPAWPDAPVDFGDPASADQPLAPFTHELSTASIRAERWTCRLSSESIRNHLARKPTPPIVIHAIDADLAMPLLAYWALRHRARLVQLVAELSKSADVRLVLPDDLPRAWRREFKKTPGLEWLEPKYPAAHWRMLPHALGIPRQRPLVLDVVAATDLADALSGLVTDARPIAINDIDRAEPVSFKIVSRSAPFSNLIDEAPHDELAPQWIAGPRWRRRVANLGETVGDGELVFHAQREKRERQSPCIRCGWCEFICPTQCSPTEFLRAQREHDLPRAKRAGVDSCIDCGLCTNVCPSNLPLNLFIDRLRSGQSTNANVETG